MFDFEVSAIVDDALATGEYEGSALTLDEIVFGVEPDDAPQAATAEDIESL